MTTLHRRDDAHRQLIFGVFIIAIGVLFLFDQFDFFSFGRAVSLFWPLLLIWMGVSRLMRRNARDLADEDQQNAR